MKKRLLLFCIALFFIKPITMYAQVNVQDSLALVDYYDSTYGVSPWQWGQSWNLQDPVNTWTGVGVNNSRVVSIHLWGGGHGGHIPSSFGNLTGLQSIDFLDFMQTESLPQSFKNLVSLTGIRFHAVFYLVPFPTALTKVPNLSSIDFEDNYFIDSIPAAIGNMPKLANLNLFQNNLSGIIPISINTIDSLKFLDISYNHYTFRGISPFVNDYITSQKTYKLAYSPQNDIPIYRYKNKLAVSPGDIINDTLRWYKNGLLVATLLQDSTYAPSDTGQYRVAVTNSIAKELTLNGAPINLHFILSDSLVTTTRNITGTAATNLSNGIFEIAKVQPTAGANQLTGSVTALVEVDTAVTMHFSQPFVQRHYDITPAANATNAQATVTLYFTQQDFDSYNYFITSNALNFPLLPTNGVDNGNVQIVQFHGSYIGSSNPENYHSSNIIFITPKIVWDGVNQWWAVSFPVTGFSGFFLRAGNTVLPVTLFNFNGKLSDHAINLQWQTSNEIDKEMFTVQRSTNNSFIDVGNVIANENNSYSFTDAHPLIGDNLYRLKMIDADGKITFSKVITVKFGKVLPVFEIYPNPVRSILNVKISSDKNEDVHLTIIDALGKEVQKNKIAFNAGVNNISLNIQKLPSGVYYLFGYINGLEEKQLFIKSK